jgi:hypothetical protein
MVVSPPRMHRLRDDFDELDLLVPGQLEYDRAIAQGEYEFARTRFVRTVTSDGIGPIIDRAARQRAKLREELANLRTLARARHEEALEDARAYASILPHRVGKTWIQPPAALEKMGAFHGSQHSYKRAVRSAKDYVEVRDLFVKRRDELIVLEEDLRRTLDDREAALLRQLESPRSFKTALQRDPLLNVAYQKLQALRVDLAESPSETGLGDL